jgi:hypothetical protein
LILNPQYVLVGRQEIAKEGWERFMVEHLSTALRWTHDLFRKKVVDRDETWWGSRANTDLPLVSGAASFSEEEWFWTNWNVVACVGSWGKWHTYMLMYFPELGVHPAPSIQNQWAFTISGPKLVRVAVDVDARAPVIYETSRLISAEKWPIEGVKEEYALRALEGILQVERHIETLGLTSRLDTRTAGGLRAALDRDGLRLELPKASGGAHAKFRTYELVQYPKPGQTKLNGVRMVETDASSLGDDAPRWANLNEALKERV